MISNEHDERTIYVVALNDEGQYSIWPADRELPRGWREAGKSGPKEECLEYIREVWTASPPADA